MSVTGKRRRGEVVSSAPQCDRFVIVAQTEGWDSEMTGSSRLGLRRLQLLCGDAGGGGSGGADRLHLCLCTANRHDPDVLALRPQQAGADGDLGSRPCGQQVIPMRRLIEQVEALVKEDDEDEEEVTISRVTSAVSEFSRRQDWEAAWRLVEPLYNHIVGQNRGDSLRAAIYRYHVVETPALPPEEPQGRKHRRRKRRRIA